MDILVTLFGRFHPLLVHFPIALIVVVTTLRVVALVLKRPRLNAGTTLLVYVAAVSAVVSAGAGLALASGDTWHGSSADRLELHRWLGLAGSGMAVVAAIVEYLRRHKENDVMNAVFLVLSAGLVSAGAHLGGELVFGEDHFSSAFREQTAEAEPVDKEAPKKAPDDKKPDGNKPDGNKPDDNKPDDKKAQANVDFKTQIWPILDKSCLRCHGAKKQKGELRLDNKQHALKGGESGDPAIVPGKSKDSKLFQLITLPDDHDDFMPAKGDPLTQDQRALIGRWIDEGADWPE